MSPAVRGRVVVAAVAAGAFVAAAQTTEPTATGEEGPTDITWLAASGDAASSFDGGVGGQAPALPEIVPVGDVPLVDEPPDIVPAASDEMQALAKGERIDAERDAKEAEARRPKVVKPAEGRFTSGFGARWGTSHTGVDIANDIGTPILAVADGTVIESGPASGFGMWVRLQHTDGTVTIYGHINRSLVEQGQQVKAGDQIAEMGNRGFSTGPHLHFEVWQGGGEKVDPRPWLAERGVEV